MKTTRFSSCLVILLSVLFTACSAFDIHDESRAVCKVGDESIVISQEGKRSYFFDKSGITFNGVAWKSYTKPMSLILGVIYERSDEDHGALTTVSLDGEEPDAVVMGTIDKGCWSSLKTFLGDMNPPVKTTETMTNDYFLQTVKNKHADGE